MRRKIDYFSRRDFLKLAGLGAATTAVLTGCGRSTRTVGPAEYYNGPKSPLPAYDFSKDNVVRGGDEVDPIPFVLAATFIPSSAVQYKDNFINSIHDPTDPFYLGKQSRSPQMYHDWISTTRVDNVTQSIFRDFLNPGGTNDFLYPENWTAITRVGGANSIDEHWQLLNAIGQEGLDGQSVHMKGYYADIQQPLKSNILRQVFVIERNGKPYVVKILPAVEARNEMGALSLLQGSNPDLDIKVPNSTTFQLTKTPLSKMSITVSDAVIGPDGLPAPTLDDLMTTGKVNENHRQQLLRLYQAFIRNIANEGQPRKLGADLFKPGNLVVDPVTDNIVVVDAFSLNRPSLSVLENNQIKTTNKDLNAHITSVRRMLMQLGLSQEQLVVTEGATMSQMRAAYQSTATEILPGAAQAVSIIADDGAVVSVDVVTNNLEKPIVTPTRMPLWAKATLWGTGVLATYGITKELHDKLWSGDNFYEAIQLPASDTNRRGLDIDNYMEISDGKESDKPYHLGHTTFGFDLENAQTKVHETEWLTALKEGLGITPRSNTLQVRMSEVPPSSFPETGLSLGLEDSEYGSPILTLEMASPVVVMNENQELAFVQVHNSRVIDVRIPELKSIETKQTELDIFEDTVNFQVNYGYPSGEKWKILDDLQRAFDDGIIDFFTTTDEGYIMYGQRQDKQIIMRYLAYEDITSRSYVDTEGKLHNLNRALTILDLVNL